MKRIRHISFLFSIIILLVPLAIGCNKNQPKLMKLEDLPKPSNIKDISEPCFLGQDFDDAKEELNKFLKNPKTNLLKGEILIKNKEQLIAVAEPILFEIYGKEDIIDERPYEIYLLGDYWIMRGTLTKGLNDTRTVGGTLSFAINRKTCLVLGISHGK